MTACSGPQSSLDPAGPSALMVSWLWWGMFAAFTAVLVAVVALWLYALIRKPPVQDESWARRITHRWIIGGGIILPASSVIVLLAFGIPFGYRMLPLPLDRESLTVSVIGHQWWWEIRYPEAGVITANELYMPVGEAVDFHLTSSDVIHSFWIPRLGGKLDALPGRVNILRLEASEAGSFRGQCAEFCGWGHAHMAFSVEARGAEDFAAWLQARQQPVEVAPGHEAAVVAFQQNCGDCHRVNGISEGGAVPAPDLSTIGARPMVGGRPRHEINAIAYWLRSHQIPADSRHSSRPSAVPDHSEIAPQAINEIAAWLETLGDD